MPDTTTPSTLRTLDLGLIPYDQALALQRETHAQVLADEAPETLYLLEHPPVITISKRRGTREHLVASSDYLAKLGIDVQDTDRGGDITYHGPGQLVAYPIVRLAPRRLTPSSYMRLLEDVVINTIARWGVLGHREPRATGVWVDAPESSPAQRLKLCAMGVRVRRNVAMHGIALNVDPPMHHFDTIVPCGLAGRGVASLAQLLGEGCPSMDEVKRVFATSLQARLDEAAGRG